MRRLVPDETEAQAAGVPKMSQAEWGIGEEQLGRGGQRVQHGGDEAPPGTVGQLPRHQEERRRPDAVDDAAHDLKSLRRRKAGQSRDARGETGNQRRIRIFERHAAIPVGPP